ncbi:unnamed protein product [Pleuronectes platessa]|uniref:Uncharacterized protein n=1 Tax=Pleuronectes platessa TaxID=8262 RepID=A0A9N7V6E3_PLEPL|nr:unnamed protein product [Pleuronectes platessa]
MYPPSSPLTSPIVLYLLYFPYYVSLPLYPSSCPSDASQYRGQCNPAIELESLLFESEPCWGNSRSAEVMGLSGKQHVSVPAFSRRRTGHWEVNNAEISTVTH